MSEPNTPSDPPKEPAFSHLQERYMQRHSGVEPTSFKSYDEVPVWKKRWFFVLMILLITPVGIILALTSDIYMSQNGQVLKFGKTQRVGIAIVWTGLVMWRLIRLGYI
jgi:hypothetical protein